MEILLIGLSHKTAPVEVRERLYFDERGLGEPLRALCANSGIEEAVILSTCNRVDVVVRAEASEKGAEALKGFLASYHGVVPQELELYLYHLDGEEAVRHVFRVCCGLDSMVMGEPQILGQVKDAYEVARQVKATGLVLNQLFSRAFRIAKRARTDTAIGRSAVSVGYAAVELAKKIFGSLDGKLALLVGAGEMCELAAKHLLKSGVKSVFVSNRTFARAVELANVLHGNAIRFEHLLDEMPHADIVISSTGAPHYVIRKEDVQRAIRARKNRPMFFIDIAVPRDIDPEVNDIENVYLYDIDDLQGVVDANLLERQREAQKAEEMVSTEVADFMAWLNARGVVPTIVTLREKFDEIRAREVERVLAKYNGLSPQEAEAVKYISFSLTNKFLHAPTTELKRMADAGERDDLIWVLKKLFRLDSPE